MGWIAAEVGRQPWIVQGLLRTRDGVSPVVSTGEVLTTLLALRVVYTLLFVDLAAHLHRHRQEGARSEASRRQSQPPKRSQPRPRPAEAV